MVNIRKKLGRWSVCTALVLCMLLTLLPCPASAADETTGNAIQNASFEEPAFNNYFYQQLPASSVPAWSTTAKENKIELVSKRYDGKVLHIGEGKVEADIPDGEQFAELNADEESTLYQDLDTLAGHVYEWGLDHRGRSGIDKMVLIIGPAQATAPSKPTKTGRDQFMQMTEWAEKNAEALGLSVPDVGCSKKVVVYSTPFAENGGFSGGNSEEHPAFSATSSDIYTEAWSLWIIADDNAEWGKYGTNSDAYNGEAGVGGGLDYQCSYEVPAGQTKTTFAFCAYSAKNANKTIGNLIDDLDFRLYDTAVVSATSGGSGRVSTDINGIEKATKVPESTSVSALVRNGYKMKLEAYEPLNPVSGTAADAEFTGAFITLGDGSGRREFIPAADWIRSESEDQTTATYTNSFEITAPVEVVLIFIRTPTVTYEANGGQEYIYETDAADPTNVVSFRPAVDGTPIRTEYTSHAAVGQDDNWKFDGWLLARKDKLLPAVHTVSYDQDSGTFAIQSDGSELYRDQVKGLTLVAQWRWKQSAIMELRNGQGAYTKDANCGTVLVEPAEVSDETPNSDGDGSCSYFAKAGERVTMTATVNPGYRFLGWFQKTGENGDQLQRVSTAESYTYTVAWEEVQTLYARYAPIQTVTYQWTTDSAKLPPTLPMLPSQETVARWQFYQPRQPAVTKVPDRVDNIPGNWVFTGWKDDEGEFVTVIEVTNDVVLTGEWAFVANSKYTVTYVSGDDPEQNWLPADLPEWKQESQIYEGDPVAVPAAPDIPSASQNKLVCNGTSLQGTWAFLGAKRSDTGKVLQPGDSFTMPAKNVTLTGQWKFTPDTFTIKYNLNGVEDNPPEPQNAYDYPEDVTVKGGFDSTKTGIPIGANVVLRDFTANAPHGTYFAGWSTSNTDGMGITLYQGGQNVSSNSLGVTSDGTEVTLYAIYRDIHSVTVQFSSNDPNGGTVSVGSGMFEATKDPEDFFLVSGNDVTSTAVPSSGYHFAGWYRKNGDTLISVSSNNELTITGGALEDILNSENWGETSHVFYYVAYFEPNQFTVRFDANGGHGTMDDRAFQTESPAGGNADLPASAFTRPGCDFAGWATMPDGDVAYYDQQTIFLKENITLYAVWREKKVSLSYRSADERMGSVSQAAETLWAISDTEAAGSTAQPNSGYQFMGWYDAQGNLLSENLTYVPQQTGGVWREATYYARFAKIRYDDGGHSSHTDTKKEPQTPPTLDSVHHTAYIMGYADGTIRPNNPITRGEVATIFFRLLSDETRDTYLTYSSGYSDVPDDMWCSTAVSTLSSMGIITGYSDGTFRPGSYITRAEFAAIASRFDSDEDAPDAPFTDTQNCWAIREISRAYARGWVNGYGDGTFRPSANITRAAAITLINRVLQRLPETAGDLLSGQRTWSDNPADFWAYLAIQEATNSHAYIQKGNGYETQTEAIPNRNWAAEFER